MISILKANNLLLILGHSK